MGSVYGNTLGDLSRADVAAQDADTRQRAADLAYLSTLANAAVMRAGDAGRERVGMRTTDNNREVGMRDADIRQQLGLGNLRMNQELGAGQLSLGRDRMVSDADLERARQVNALKIAMAQAQAQKDAQMAQAQAALDQIAAQGANGIALQSLNSGTVDPNVIRFLAQASETSDAAQAADDAAIAAALNGSVNRNPTWSINPFKGWDSQDFARENQALQDAVTRIPGGTNRFSIVGGKENYPTVIVNPRKPNPSVTELLQMSTRRPITAPPIGTNAPVSAPAASAPSGQPAPMKITKDAAGFVILYKNGKPVARAAEEHLPLYLKQGYTTQ